MTELTPGTEVDRYRVDSILGEGGTATVFLVSHRTLKTQRALKVLHVTNKKLQERLPQEALILSTIEHHNIVRIIDALEVGGSPAVVMEYVNGPPLDQYLQDSPPSLATAEAIFLGILDGVERAHKAGIVHRDLKPANVLLAIENGKPVPKVADFGIARVFGESEGARLTKTGSAMGTASYMPPEQIMDASSVDQRADIFALGCILYEMATGQLAFDGANFMATFDAIRAGKYTPPEELIPDLPDRFQRTIRACMQSDRERRPADCAQVRALLSGNGATAVPADPPADTTTETRKRPPKAPPKTSSETFALGVEAPLTVELEPAPKATGSRSWMFAVGAAALTLVGVAVWHGATGSTSAADASPAATSSPATPSPPSPDPTTQSPALPSPVPASAAAPVPSYAPAAIGPAPVAAIAQTPAATVASQKPAAAVRPVDKPAAATPPLAAAPAAVAPPAAVAAPAPTGRVNVTGATSFTIRDASGASVHEGLPPGHYTVEAVVGGRTVKVGVNIDGGDTVTVACDDTFSECAVK